MPPTETEATPKQVNGDAATAEAPPPASDHVNGHVNSAAQAQSDDEIGVDVEVEHVTKKKKKKSKSRPKSKRGLNAPDGFEEFFADSPITPEQYAEDQGFYSSDLPFINRILTAIQRFERTRKMSPERRDIFYKYLAYGGVEISPNMFQSAADLDQASMDKDELAMALSKVSIGTDKYDLTSPKALYTVDFLGCMQAFLSRHAPHLYASGTQEQVALITTTLERFMDYLLQHDVCPEYRSEVLATRNCCRSAKSELWACFEAYRWLPGDFNIACSTLFGGVYSENYTGSIDWETDSNAPTTFVGMNSELATQVLKMGVAGAATEAVYQKYMAIINAKDGNDSFEVISREPDAGFTVTKIFQPTKDCIKLYKTQSADFRPVGRIVAKPWVNPDLPPRDLTPTEREALSNDNTITATSPSFRLKELKEQEYTFLLETPLITHMRVGMHIEATIHLLNCGIWWFDSHRVVYPSFDKYLCNDLMIGWKEPRWLKGSMEYELEEERERERKKEEEEEGRGEGWMGKEEVEVRAGEGPGVARQGEGGGETTHEGEVEKDQIGADADKDLEEEHEL